jgi:biofilm PGA synthesis N-glycosyltransferase PgaC
MINLEYLFWLFFGLIVFHYIGFGVLVMIIGKLFGKKNHILQIADSDLPTVSFIVAAYNEERIIEQKIKNDLGLDYPKDKLEIIVVSDGSTDSTQNIIQNLQKLSRLITALHSPERKGKTAALNRAIALAKNEILVFSDANSFFKADALKKLVRHFNDPRIGGVCGRKSILFHEGRKASLGDRLYWIYESYLKQAESHLGSIATADGEIFALRKRLFKPVSEKLINDDLVITLNIIQQDYRVIYDQSAITEEEASLSLKDDFNVKSRMVYGGLQIIALYFSVLNPLKSWFGLQFFFHKTLRYLMWILLIGILTSNILLIPMQNSFYTTFVALQILFYLMALTGFLLDRKQLPTGILYLPYYYCNVNVAAAKGFWFFIKQQSNVDVWKKAQR